MIRRVLAAVLLAVVLTPATVALAHAPGPTNFRTEIVGITPDLGVVSARIIGGDSFIELRVASGHDVVVVGYKGERYLHFLADGTVQENAASVTHYSNSSRFGGTIPADVDPPAAERWTVVAHGGRWAWHDHRTHWMNSFDPPGHHPGDVILEGVVPLKVDAQDVSIAVRSIWIATPSLLGPLVAAVAGVGIVALVAARARRHLWLVLAVVAGLGLYVGIRQFSSVPAVLKPDRLAWILPLAALVCVVPVGVLRRRLTPLTITALEACAAAEVVVWCVLRRLNIVRAVLPTSMSFAVDRLVTGICFGVAAASLVVVLGPAVRAALPQRHATAT